MVTPIFDSAVNRLIGDVVRAPKGQAGAVASTVITIARARYTMSVMGAGDWLNFDVKGLSLFEESTPVSWRVQSNTWSIG